MQTGFEQKAADFIRVNGLLASADKLLLATSGGADSTALMHLMHSLKQQGVFNGDIICAHINHQLRGPLADADENFVVTEAGKLNLPVIARRVNVREFAKENKLSIETAARKLRIDSLLDIAQSNGISCIATAHQKNDNAETVIHRLHRGTGFRGLAGIWPKRQFGGTWFVRPLLCFCRDEIIEYLEKHNLKWRTDHTNEDCTYRRNFIRHRLLPALQKNCEGSLVEQLFNLSQSARRLYGLVSGSADSIWPQLIDKTAGAIKLHLEDFLGQPEILKVEMIRRCLVDIGCGEGNLTGEHYERILQLARQRISGKKIELAGNVTVLLEYQNLFFTRSLKTVQQATSVRKSIRLKVPGRTKFGNHTVEASIIKPKKGDFERFRREKTQFVEWFDANKVKLPITVRFRQKGDRFWPLGLADKKKTGKFLTDAKVPQQIRRKSLIIADSEKIIWLWPVRISEQAKITDKTQEVLRLQITGLCDT